MMIRQRGFTLLETLVALVLFAVVSSSMSSAFINHVKFNTSMEVKTGAIAAAQQVLDDLRSQDPSAMGNSGSTSLTITAGDRDYDVDITLCEDLLTFCNTSNIRQISLDIWYAGKKVYEVETVFTKLK